MKTWSEGLARQVIAVVAVTAMLLMVPLLGMLLGDQINWGLGDFVLAALLIGGTGLAFVFGSALVRTRGQRIILGAVLAFVMLAIWAEAAVGIFD